MWIQRLLNKALAEKELDNRGLLVRQSEPHREPALEIHRDCFKTAVRPCV